MAEPGDGQRQRHEGRRQCSPGAWARQAVKPAVLAHQEHSRAAAMGLTVSSFRLQWESWGWGRRESHPL